MARYMHVGDTWQPLRGQASDEDGTAVDLSSALSLVVECVSAAHTITGDAEAVWPAIADDDGVHHWNWQYNPVPGDTDNAGTYAVYLIVTWEADKVEVYPDRDPDTLVILPLGPPVTP